MTIATSESGLDEDKKRAWRHDNIGRLLMTGFSYFEAALIRRVHDSGFPLIRYVHFNVIRHLDFDGTRIVELASRAGITKGGMGQIVRECEKLGIVKVMADPDDGRAKVVYLEKKGVKLLNVMHQAMAEVQVEMTSIIGKNAMSVTTKAMLAIRKHMSSDLEANKGKASRVRIHR